MPDAGSLLSPKKDFKVLHVSLATKGVEYSQALPAGTRGYTLRIQSGLKLQLAFEPGKSNTEFISVHGSHCEEHIDPSTPLTLYMRGIKNGDVAEILTWK